MHIRTIFGISALALLAACGGGGGGSEATAPVTPATPVVTTPVTPVSSIKGSITTDTQVASVKTSASYQVSVYVPADYSSTTDKLPVIYALDGGADNGTRMADLAGVLEEQKVRAILVGIGGYARRRTDFLMPGAQAYWGFISTELLPAVEAKFPRIDQAKRTLDGHSFGGFFVLYAMTKDRPDAPKFAAFIAHDPGSTEQGEQLKTMENDLFARSAGKLGATRIVLSGDLQGNDAIVSALAAQIGGHHYEGLNLQRVAASNLGHEPMLIPSFRESVKLMFQ